MEIYDKNGNSLPACYGKDGSALSAAYDVNSTQIWTSAPPTIKVGTYNVGDWGWGAGLPPVDDKETYLALQNTLFAEIDVDICAMQEWSASFCSDGTKSNVVTDKYFEYLQGQTYWAIGSNIAFDGFQVMNYTTCSPGGDYAKYEKAYFEISGRRVCLINCHFSTAQSMQEAQAAEILTVAREEEYCIVCGDWNTVIHSMTDTDYTVMVKPYIDAGFTDANCGEFGIFPTYYGTSNPQADYRPATDHIIVSSNITITNAYVNTTKLTDDIDAKIDHVPLIAELTIN